jgi:hypothetical protein
VHFEAGDADEKPRAGEYWLFMVLAEHVADVLAQKAFDALAEFLDAVGFFLSESWL